MYTSPFCFCFCRRTQPWFTSITRGLKWAVRCVHVSFLFLFLQVASTFCSHRPHGAGLTWAVRSVYVSFLFLPTGGLNVGPRGPHGARSLRAGAAGPSQAIRCIYVSFLFLQVASTFGSSPPHGAGLTWAVRSVHVSCLFLFLQAASTLVHVDHTGPDVSVLGLQGRLGRGGLYVHSSTDLAAIRLAAHVSDAHSGIRTLEVSMGTRSLADDVAHRAAGVHRLDNVVSGFCCCCCCFQSVLCIEM